MMKPELHPDLDHPGSVKPYWDYAAFKDGKPVRDITDHDAPSKHPYPHQHRHIPNKTGGT